MLNYNSNKNEPEMKTIPAIQASRLTSLDVFRGIIIAGMILVTDPGTYDAIYPQLRHADWMGATATDMIFPSFLFMVGMSIVLSVNARLSRGDSKGRIASKIFYRTALLFILGLLVNGFPDYNLQHLRLPGILQRIAICYCCCGLFYLYINDFTNNVTGQINLKFNLLKFGGTALALLLLYWALLMLVPVPGIGTGLLDSYGNLPAYIDRHILTINHMWAYGLTPGKGVTYDPEGILSTLPAIASTLIGVLIGEWWIKSTATAIKKISLLSLAGATLVILALVFNMLLPINKRIWTSSFALLSSGVAMLLFAIIYLIVDLKRIRRWSDPFLILGSNAILAFVISSVITTLFDRIHTSQSSTIHQWGNQLMVSFGLSPVNASLLYALIIVAMNILIILPFYQKKIFLKI